MCLEMLFIAILHSYVYSYEVAPLPSPPSPLFCFWDLTFSLSFFPKEYVTEGMEETSFDMLKNFLQTITPSDVWAERCVCVCDSVNILSFFLFLSFFLSFFSSFFLAFFLSLHFYIFLIHFVSFFLAFFSIHSFRRRETGEECLDAFLSLPVCFFSFLFSFFPLCVNFI